MRIIEIFHFCFPLSNDRNKNIKIKGLAYFFLNWPKQVGLEWQSTLFFFFLSLSLKNDLNARFFLSRWIIEIIISQIKLTSP